MTVAKPSDKTRLQLRHAGLQCFALFHDRQ